MARWIQLRDADMNVGYTGGWCLKYVQDAFGTDHPFPSAVDAWNGNVGNGNHAGDTPPLGITVPVYFSLGNVPAGHVAIRLDDGYVASSTQAGYHAKPYFHPNLSNLISVYGPPNGGCSFLGWSEYVGNVKVVGWEDYNDQRYSEAIQYEKTTESDDTLPVGQTVIKQAGVNGEHWWVDRIRAVDGIEQSRARVDEGVNAAVAEITSIGTFVEPAVPVPPPDPEIPVPPVEPAPPVENENSIIRRIMRIINYIITKINQFLKEK